MATTASQRIMTTAETADYLNVAVATLETWRCRGGGPPFVKLGRRAIRYLKEDLDCWIESQRCEN